MIAPARKIGGGLVDDPRSVQFEQSDPYRPPAPKNTMLEDAAERMARAGRSFRTAPRSFAVPRALTDEQRAFWAAIDATVARASMNDKERAARKRTRST